ncbi:DNA polymerase Y family protein [bacterium]|nr:DNA polymerase Y family protein [bacterium]
MVRMVSLESLRAALKERTTTEQTRPDRARLEQVRRARDLPAPTRLACVDLPAWPLQLLVRRHPDWRELPAAVVAEDSPQAPLLWVNTAARRAGVQPGMRYAAALSLAHELRAGTVPGRVLEQAGRQLHRHLLRHSPRVEPARHEPGVFWLDARGLERLPGSGAAWAEQLQRSLVAAGWVASVAVGFTRFGSYGLARTRRGVTVAGRKGDELGALRRVPLARLHLLPDLRDQLDRLGVRTVGELCDLPAAGVGARFGPEAAELHRLARDVSFAPLQPVRPAEPACAEEVLDEPETDAWRLLFVIKRRLHPLLEQLADRLRAVRGVGLELVLADRASTCRRETLQPAAPTLDPVLLLELVRLRLERLELAAGVELVRLRLDDAPATPQALDLFRRQRERDPAAAARALARVRAELGDQAVVRAELTGAQLPEARTRWRPMTEVPVPRVPGGATPTLVRRLASCPREVPAPRPEFLRGGPFRLSGGWWQGEVRRRYAFVEVAGRALRWVFLDERRGVWREQGRVE